jgi:hypothetical protein
VAELPVTYNLKAYRGDTWAQTFRFVFGGTPVPWSGATVACWAVSRSEQYELPCVPGDEDGLVTIRMPDPELPAGAYSYDVEVTDSGGIVTTWVRGRLTVEQDVTNAD